MDIQREKKSNVGIIVGVIILIIIVGLLIAYFVVREKNAVLREWTTGDWSECSAKCGGGTQTRLVVCPGEECDMSKKPTDTQSCNTQACAAWIASDWEKCSKECGGGTQTRTVKCGGDVCLEKEKPMETQECNKQECEWRVGEFGPCSTLACEKGVQTRKVECPIGVCDEAKKPVSSKPCDTGCIQYLGCYMDDEERTLKQGGKIEDVFGCYKIAKEKGATYFGMQYRQGDDVSGNGECFYGDATSQYNRIKTIPRDKSDCDIENGYMLGGFWSNAVYQIK